MATIVNERPLVERNDVDAKVWFAPGSQIRPEQIVAQSLNSLLTVDVLSLDGYVAEISFTFAKDVR